MTTALTPNPASAPGLDTPSTKSARDTALRAFFLEIESILTNAPVSPETLRAISARLLSLAQHEHLFSQQDYPPPAPESGDTSVRYRLNPSESGLSGGSTIALYLNSLLPGKTTIPHNHDTWAVIAAIEGEEVNRLYRRTDDGTNPDVAEIVQTGEVLVKPGTPIAFMPEDIHSIHVEGRATTRHFHLYGRPLETLVGRLGFEPDSGKIVRYNQAHGTAKTQTVG